jgi:type VI secretion system protein ImpF
MQRFTPFLLDRLIDASPADVVEPVRLTLTLEQMKDSVARDLEALLNARCSVDSLAAGPYARRSLLRFGLEDFSARTLSSMRDREAICRAIEQAVADHEPRLTDVCVDIDAREAPGARLRFTIRALLQLHPTTAPVNFDAVLQTGSQHYLVSATSRTAGLAR